MIFNNFDDFAAADAILSAHGRAGFLMQQACEKMLEASRTANNPEARRRYGKVHKQMVKLKRDWNRLEEIRESDEFAAKTARQ